MQTKLKFFDEFAKLAMGAAGVASQMQKDSKGFVQKRLETVIDKADFVPRDEFEAVKSMAAKARLKQDELEKRLDALEALLKEKKAPKAAKIKK